VTHGSNGHDISGYTVIVTPCCGRSSARTMGRKMSVLKTIPSSGNAARFT
jgi:hypothetical protein